MIDKERIKVGLRFTFLRDEYQIVEIYKNNATIENLSQNHRFESTIAAIQNFCDELPETPEQKGRRETDYADKVIQDIEQFELDNIEYLRDKIQEKIDRIR